MNIQRLASVIAAVNQTSTLKAPAIHTLNNILSLEDSQQQCQELREIRLI